MNPQTTAPEAPAAAPANNDPGQFGHYSDWAAKEMANGFSADQLKQHLAQQGVDVNTNPHGSGNWLTHLLPTIGSVAIPALGALLAPETGGLSLVAAAGLSGLGAAGGKAVENATEGKGVGDDVLKEGVMGAAGGAAGGVAGKFLGKASSMLGNAAENVATKTATQAAAKDSIDGLATAYKDVPIGLQKAYNATDSLKHVGEMGFDAADPKNLIHVANTSNDALNGVLDKALADSGPVNLAHYTDIVKQRLAEEGANLGSFDKVALSRGRFTTGNTDSAKLLSQLEDLGAGVAKENADPNEIRTLTTKLYNLAQDAKPGVSAQTGAIDPVQKSIYNVISKVRNDVKGALYDRPEVNEALQGQIGNLTAEDVGSQQLADHLNNIIATAGKGNNTAAQDLLSNISRHIDIKNLGDEGLKAGQVVTSTGAKARAASAAGLNEAEAEPSLIDAVQQVGGGGHGGIINTAIKGAVHASQNPAVLSTLSRIGALGSKLAPPAGAIAGTAAGMGADPVGGAAPGGTMNNNGMDTMQHNGNSYQSLLDAMQAQAVLAPSVYGATATPFMQSVAPQLQKNNLLASSIPGLEASFDNAGGPQGQGGIMSMISSMIPGTAANNFQKQKEAAAQQLAATMGISPQAAMALLPGLMQNGGTAGMNEGILGSLQGQLAH